MSRFSKPSCPSTFFYDGVVTTRSGTVYKRCTELNQKGGSAKFDHIALDTTNPNKRMVAAIGGYGQDSLQWVKPYDYDVNGEDTEAYAVSQLNPTDTRTNLKNAKFKGKKVKRSLKKHSFGLPRSTVPPSVVPFIKSPKNKNREKKIWTKKIETFFIFVSRLWLKNFF